MTTLDAASSVDVVQNACCVTVARLWRCPGFRYLEAGDLLERVSTTARQNSDCTALAAAGEAVDTIVYRLAMGIYSAALYAGCMDPHPETQRRAFAELAEYVYTDAYNLFRNDPNGQTIAEECSQESLISLYKSLKKVVSPAAFLAYASTTVTHQCGKAMKQLRLDREHTMSLPADDPGEELNEAAERTIAPLASTATNTATQPDAAGAPLESDVLDCLQRAVARLKSEGLKAVLLLRYLGSLGDHEIANLLSLEKGAVQTRMTRALAQLRRDEQFVNCLDDWRVLQSLLRGEDADWP